jgi:hypothetical protein
MRQDVLLGDFLGVCFFERFEFARVFFWVHGSGQESPRPFYRAKASIGRLYDFGSEMGNTTVERSHPLEDLMPGGFCRTFEIAAQLI